MKTAALGLILVPLLTLSSLGAHPAEDLEKGFASPPDSSKPLTWWHWLDGNITKQGITADLEAMKRAGLGGAYMFNCGVGMPQGDVRFLQPRWLEMFDHAVKESERLGITFGIHNCDGFSQSGGPWIKPEASMKELTWTATDAPGATVFDAALAQPETKEGFYRDVAVVAFPVPQGDRLTGPGTTAAVRGTLSPEELSKLIDGKAQTHVAFPSTGKPHTVEFVFDHPQTVRSLVCRNASPHRWEEDFPIQLEVSADGTTFHAVGAFTANWDMIGGGEVTVACEAATGTVFRLSFCNPWPVSIGEVELSESARVHFAEAKAARLRSRGHGAESRHHAAYPGPDRTRPLAPELVIARSAVTNLTTRMAPDGHLKWQVPPGHWRILRVGFTSNGHYVSPATPEGRGLECDKLDPKIVRSHLEQYVGKLVQLAGPAAGKTLAAMEVDSWECGIQNWTAGFERRFREHQGYDLLPFLPTMLEGWIVDSADVSERAMWDWRRFLSDQFAQNYYAVVAGFAKEKRLTYVGESTGRQQYLYDVASMRNTDVPMGEFWNNRETGQGVRVDNKVAASIAHTAGKPIVASEAYTSGGESAAWNNHPFTMKPLGDRAFCAGVNEFVFHTFAHQPYTATGPGFTFASWGLNFNRANTWWGATGSWMAYLTRCNHMLRQGQQVCDVLWFVGEDVPNRIAWRDELHPVLPAGYEFDGCDARAVLEAHVADGRIVLPSGAEYRVLLLPDLPTLRPAVAKKVLELAQAGATILAPRRPLQSPSLCDRGAGDEFVQTTIATLSSEGQDRPLGRQPFKGQFFINTSFEEVFKRIALAPDFETRAAAKDSEILYVHRRIGGAEAYFLSNQLNRPEAFEALFRTAGKFPELWDPSTGSIVRPGVFRFEKDGRVAVPLRLDPNGSVFVMFRDALGTRHAVALEAPTITSGKAPPAPVPPAGVTEATGTFTLALWVKPDTEIPLPQERKDGVAIRGQNWAVFAPQGQAQFGDGHAGAGIAVGRNGIVVFEHSARYAPAVITLPADMQEGASIALVYRAGIPTLFVNGREIRSGAKGPHVVHAAPGGGPAFRGERSAPLLFDRALTAEEIAALARASTPLNTLPQPAELERSSDGIITALFWEATPYNVLFEDGTRTALIAPALPAPITVSGPWQVSFPPGLGAPKTATLDALSSWSDHADPGIRFFSGTATYEKVIDLPADMVGADRDLYLDLGDIAVIAEVELNGKNLGVLWKPPFRVRVDGVAKAGENRLVVRITNLWRNRMIGDASLPDDDIEWGSQKKKNAYPARWPDWLVQGKPRPSARIAFCTRKDVYAKDDPLLPSGLLGPVTIRAAQRVVVK